MVENHQLLLVLTASLMGMIRYQRSAVKIASVDLHQDVRINEYCWKYLTSAGMEMV